jgi:cytochrome P450
VTDNKLAEGPLLFDTLVERWNSLREKGPVCHDEAQGVWQVVDHHGVGAVLGDPATYSSDMTPIAPAQEDFDTFRQGNFVAMDPPRHRKLRTLVSQAFTPRIVQGLAPRIEDVVTRLLDAVDDRDSFDLVDALAHPLPVIVIAELLGVPDEDHPLFQ